ncbi:hypothetical protein GCM10023116_32780 [Kistimonas scapharcae]|uniref:Uncharacterized protein n=1 Tax=Kistimonas scapharcae TaxID=1036133 RepID=A0ABP8V6Y1_9GAMM
MAILPDDVKLYASQRLTDESDGGGRATGNEVIDGDINNLFRDISRIDRTLGDVSLRKVYAGVSTDNTDPYLGAHLIITEPPQDTRVDVLLFNTDSQTDERTEARNRIESYVVPAVDAPWELLGDQLVGQRSMQAVQRSEDRLPEIGEVYRLLDENSGQEQYIRITDVTASTETFTISRNDNYVDFVRRRLTLGISSPLEQTFPGGTATPSGTDRRDSTQITRIQSTQVADAAKYYGASSLRETASSGSTQIKVNDIYAHLVPSATSETAVIDEAGYSGSRQILPTRNGTLNTTLVFGHIQGNQSRSYLGAGVVRQSLILAIDGGTYEDNGAGEFTHVSGSDPFERITIDYETGQIDVYRTSSYFTGNASTTWQPGTAATGISVSEVVQIELQNRGFTYTFAFPEEKPRPGSFVLSYMALGKWYELRDPGNGLLTGNGSGTINFATGSVAVTLEAMPDVDTALVVSYSLPFDDELTIHTGSAVAQQPEIRHTTAHPGIKPGSVAITYISGGQSKTLTDNGAAILSGDGIGSLIYASGELAFVPDTLPDVGTAITVSYEQGNQITSPVSVDVDGSGTATGTIPGAPLLPGSVKLTFTCERIGEVPSAWKGTNIKPIQIYDRIYNVTHTVSDDSTGGWKGRVGSINYATGEFSIEAEQNYSYKTYKINTYSYEFAGKTYTRQRVEGDTTTLTETYQGNTLSVVAQENALSHQPEAESVTVPDLLIRLLPNTSEPLVPGSVMFEFGGAFYQDRDGAIIRNLSTTINAGSIVGSIDYTGSQVTLSQWPDGASPAVNLVASATTAAGYQTDRVAFRTPGAPIRAGSLQISALRADTGATISAQADNNGLISSPEMLGYIDYQSGWCQIEFTDGDNPIHVIPQSIRFNSVVLTSIPLDSELIGLDPVRLPADGRVPIYRSGDVVVLAHTDNTTVNSPAAGQTVSLSRDHQAEITLTDDSGTPISSADYSVNLEAGTVTFENDLAGTLTVQDRIEQMALVSDVQISGDISLATPLAWDFPAEDTLVSSAVVYGDLQSRVHDEFTQRTWDSGEPNWSNHRVGDDTTAQYNLINYPIEISNKGAVDGRWAIIFTSSSTFRVVEENLGIIATGSTGSDCAPMNPETHVPYFIIRFDGWGTGWSSGNVLRFNTTGALAPCWLVRTVLSGQGTIDDDRFTLQIRGDAD